MDKQLRHGVREARKEVEKSLSQINGFIKKLRGTFTEEEIKDKMGGMGFINGLGNINGCCEEDDRTVTDYKIETCVQSDKDLRLAIRPVLRDCLLSEYVPLVML